MPRRTTPTSSARRAGHGRTPVEQARAWWAEQAGAGRYVVAPSEGPSPAAARVLRQEGLVMEVAGRRAWILTTSSPQDRRSVFLANYWPVVAVLLDRYSPAAIAGLEAVRLHLGEFSPPGDLRVYHGANRSVYTLTLEPGFVARLRPHHMAGSRVERIPAPGGVTIPVLPAADLLTTLDEPEIVAGLEPVSAWLRHLVVRTPALIAAVEDNPRPQVLQRLADMAEELGNGSLAEQLDAAARRISSKVMSPARTGVGTRLQIPPVIAGQPRGVGSSWLDEQAMRLERQAAEVAAIVGKHDLTPRPIAPLIANAIEAKAHDAYHSTTMEGYRISPDVVEAILRGDPAHGGPQDEEGLRSAMAVQGYSHAFDEVLRLAERRVPITRDVMLDLHEALFRPSIDAGIVNPGDLRRWRSGPVGLAGWRHVPPNPAKVPDLVLGLERFAGRADIDTVARAMLVHLEFVTIHPFQDGNGRLGRLLMNLALLSGGLPWVTIRTDERVPFFRSIEQAQVDGETSPFVEFLWHLIRQAASDLTSRQRSSRRTRRR